MLNNTPRLLVLTLSLLINWKGYDKINIYTMNHRLHEKSMKKVYSFHENN